MSDATNPSTGVKDFHNDRDLANHIAGLLDSEETKNEEAEAELEADAETEEDGTEEGTEESEYDGTEEEESEEPIYTVKVDGEEVEVNLQELLNGYSRDNDYRRKTQKLSDERRAFETQRQEIESERQRYQQGLQQAIHYAQNFDPILKTAKETDWTKLADENPAEYTRRRAEVEHRATQVSQMQAEQQRLQAQHWEAYAKAEIGRTYEVIPEWNDENLRKQELHDTGQYLAERGFSNEEITHLVDHRQMTIARDAMLWRKHQAAQQSAKKKLVNKPVKNVLKPKAQPNRKDEVSAKQKQALVNARKSGNPRDIARAIAANLDD